eukprot:IDg4970t1
MLLQSRSSDPAHLHLNKVLGSKIYAQYNMSTIKAPANSSTTGMAFRLPAVLPMIAPAELHHGRMMLYPLATFEMNAALANLTSSSYPMPQYPKTPPQVSKVAQCSFDVAYEAHAAHLSYNTRLGF